MPIHRLVLLFSLTAFCGACSWPKELPTSKLAPGVGPDESGRAAATADMGPGSEGALAWHDLTQRARSQLRRGELLLAEETLSQAAMQLASLPAWSARRRTVFGLQARLATELARANEIERADALANQLLDLAAAEPEIGGAALIGLASGVIERRSLAEEPISTEE